MNIEKLALLIDLEGKTLLYLLGKINKIEHCALELARTAPDFQFHNISSKAELPDTWQYFNNELVNRQ